MDAIARLKMLSSQMSYEPDTEFRANAARPECFTRKEQNQTFIHPAQLPNGKNILLLKTLLSSACERDCYYCPFRAGRDLARATFQPEEFARLFHKLTQSGAAEGIFLSSGMIGGGVHTEDLLIDTAHILRHKLGFHGYIHLKIMPGADKDQVFRAMQLADRVSINLEAPNTDRLAQLAPHKQFMDELLQPLRWVDEIRQTIPQYKGWKGRWPSTVTQFVAGGADESDLELLTTTDWLHKNVHLKRAYFSAFSPVPDTPLEDKPATNPLREHRLYQASFLLRDYGFELEDLQFTQEANLPLHEDPKMAWARVNLTENPIEVNKAEKRKLIQIPGIGPRGADAILQARQNGRLLELAHLRKLGIAVHRAAPFVLVNGRRAPIQMRMF